MGPISPPSDDISAIFMVENVEMQNAVIVWRGKPEEDAISKTVWDLADKYGGDDVCAVAWEFVPQLPEWINVGLRDQLTAHYRDTEDGRYLMIWLGTEEEIEGLADEEG